MRVMNGMVRQMRRRAEAARELPRERPDGWSLSPVDPGKVVKVFRSLRLKEGWKLCAYLYGIGGNGNGVVWAIPEEQEVPLPEECEESPDGLFEPPRPPGALDNFMKVIEGSGTPRSYLSASILARELREFGALWHGTSWDCVGVMEGRGSVEDAEGDERWTWHVPPPEDYGPMFELKAGKRRITMYFSSCVGMESIGKVVDTYPKKGYVFKTSGEDIASGGPGIVF